MAASGARTPSPAPEALAERPGGLLHRGPPPHLLVAVLGGIVLLATASLWLWGRSPSARYLEHGDPPEGSPILALALFVLGWVLMTVAMMLPSALPLVRAFARVTRRRRQRAALQVVVVSAFVGVWVLFGVTAQRTDLLLHRLVDGVAWLRDRTDLVAAAVLVVGGLYQLSDVRRRCLSRCQSPSGFIVRHWSGDRPGWAAARIGADYGLFCVGCCWPVMLLMFAVGMGNVALMLVLGGLMAVEKNVPAARVLLVPLGPLLIASGGALALSVTL